MCLRIFMRLRIFLVIFFSITCLIIGTIGFIMVHFALTHYSFHYSALYPALAHHPDHGPFGVIGGSPIVLYPDCIAAPRKRGLYICKTLPYVRADFSQYHVGYDDYTGICFVQGMTDPMAREDSARILRDFHQHIASEYNLTSTSINEGGGGKDAYLWRGEALVAQGGISEIRLFIEAGDGGHDRIIEEYRFINYSGCLRSLERE